MTENHGSPGPSHGPAPSPGSEDDRIAGALLGAACGDALGVPYEFAARLGADQVPEMIGGGLGPYAPGEYSDDTQMAVCIAQVTADAPGPDSAESLDRIAENFLTWRREGASDIGDQTRRILDSTAHASGAPGVGAVMAEVAAARHASGVPSAGNGSLMRTAPAALTRLHSPRATARTSVRYSALTHADPLATDACVLWGEGIRYAVNNADLSGVRRGLTLLPPERAEQWAAWLDEAESRDPQSFAPNGFVVPALQAAYSAAVRTPVSGDDGPGHFRRAVENAVRAGDDTDTVAAIAGALLGARWGASAVPPEWRASVHGWPGLRADDLVALALDTARRGRTRPGAR